MNKDLLFKYFLLNFKSPNDTDSTTLPSKQTIVFTKNGLHHVRPQNPFMTHKKEPSDLKDHTAKNRKTSL